MNTVVATAQMKLTEDADIVARLAGSLKAQLGEATAKLVVAFASPKQSLEALLSELSRQFEKAVVVGASSAGEFTELGDIKGGVSAFALAGDYEVHAGIGKRLAEDVERAVGAALSGVPTESAGFDHKTALLMLDPLTGRGEEAVLLASTQLGPGVKLAGGAAGDDLAMQCTEVGLGGDVASDAVVAVVIFSKAPLGVGVCHGHRVLSDSLEVTRAEGAVVHEVEGRPAWDVWREHTREAARARGVDVDQLAEDEVGGFLLTYEASLAVGSEIKVRAPLSKDDNGALSFACGIPEKSVIRITRSDEASQVSSAREAARRAREYLGGEVSGAIVFDCICRNLILGQRFSDAVRGMAEELGGAKLAGFETYGEIALDVGELSGFHNTTTVVLAFPR